MSDKMQVKLRYDTRVGAEEHLAGDKPHLPSWLARRMLENGRAEAVSVDEGRASRADVGTAGGSNAASKARTARGGRAPGGSDDSEPAEAASSE